MNLLNSYEFLLDSDYFLIKADKVIDLEVLCMGYYDSIVNNIIILHNNRVKLVGVVVDKIGLWKYNTNKSKGIGISQIYLFKLKNSFIFIKR